MQMATIDIPIGGEVLEINRRDLKENEAFVFNLLNDPSYVHPLTVYIDIAVCKKGTALLQHPR